MPMNSRLLRPTQNTHPEAADWASRVRTNGGSVNGSTLMAVSRFCRAIDAAGVRDRFYRLNLFCGEGLEAALVPLYRAESRTASARGNTTDTNNNFVSGDFNNTGSSSGLNGNGSTKFLNTGLPANALTGSNTHMGIGLLANNASGVQGHDAMGVFNSLQAHIVSVRRVNNSLFSSTFGNFATNSASAGDSVNQTNLAIGNIVAAWPSFYRNGSVSGATATTSNDYPSAHAHFVFAAHNNGTSASVYANIRLGWYSIGLTMTSSQVVSFNNALNNFANTLART
jgi:hypothetical protein